MSKHRQIFYQQPIPQDFLDALQEFIGTLSTNFSISQASGTSIQVVAGAGSAQVSLGISGLWRYISATATAAHPGGAAGTYDVYAVASANSFTAGGSSGETDNTDYSFGLQILTSGATPTGNYSGRAITAYRKVGQVIWDGSQITSVQSSLFQSMPVDATTNTASLRTLGPGAQQAAAGNMLTGLVWAEGVVPGHGVGDVQTDPQLALKVALSAGLILSVQPGYALIQGDDSSVQGLYQARQAGSTTLTLTTGRPTTNPRVDAIVARWNDPAFTTRTPVGLEYVQVVGNERAGTTLATLDGAPGQTNGPALPGSALVIAYVLWATTDTTGPQSGNIGDGRKLAGPAVWGEDGHRYRIGVDSSGKLGMEQIV